MRRCLKITILCGTSLLSSLLVPRAAGAAVLPPANPGDSQPSPAMMAACSPPVNGGACDAATVAAIDAARAAEGVGPLVLPTNYYRLTPAEQLFVVVNLERVDRGLAPVSGLAAPLDADALVGAQGNTDPPPPAGVASSASLWIGGWATPLFDDFFWMYDDGPGGVSYRCCWGHRDAILTSWPLPPSTTRMGGAVATTPAAPASGAVVIAAGDNSAPYFTWAAEQPYLTFSLSAGALDLGGSPGSVESSPVTARPSGTAGRFSAGVVGGAGLFSVSPPTCTAPAGGVCTFDVTFRPVGNSPVSATLYVAGPGAVRPVALSGGPWSGYWLAAADGGVFSFGTALFHGSAAGLHPVRPVVGMAASPDRGGYWLVAADGGVFSFGTARFHGSAAGLRLAAPVVGMAADPATGGYWLVGADGGVFSFGAPFRGSAAGLRMAAPVVGMAATPDGGGYWLVGADGGVFSIGDARFYGSSAGRSSSPVVGIAPTPDGHGYWLAAADGAVYPFGDALYQGSMYGRPLSAPVRGITASPIGAGYWLAAADGGVFSFGSALFHGSLGGTALAAPVVGAG